MLMIREVAASAAIVPEFSLEALAAVVSPAAVAVEAVIEGCGVREQRRRKVPAALTIFFCIAMNLYATPGLGQVFAHLVSGLRWLWPHPEAWRVSAGALCHARARVGARVGARPLVALFKQVCRPLATRASATAPATPGAFLGNWRLMADGAGRHQVERAGHPGERAGLRTPHRVAGDQRVAPGAGRRPLRVRHTRHL